MHAMFTGIVETTAEILEARPTPNGVRLAVAADWTDVRHGESVAVNGCCLTAAELSPGRIGFDVIRETLDKTNLGRLAAGDRVHLERSLRADGRIDGHFVQGHVDGHAVSDRPHRDRRRSGGCDCAFQKNWPPSSRQRAR